MICFIVIIIIIIVNGLTGMVLDGTGLNLENEMMDFSYNTIIIKECLKVTIFPGSHSTVSERISERVSESMSETE